MLFLFAMYFYVLYKVFFMVRGFKSLSNLIFDLPIFAFRIFTFSPMQEDIGVSILKCYSVTHF